MIMENKKVTLKRGISGFIVCFGIGLLFASFSSQPPFGMPTVKDVVSSLIVSLLTIGGVILYTNKMSQK